MNDRIREAADRVERIAPLDENFREPGAPGRRFFALMEVCDEMHVEASDVVAELVRRREARARRPPVGGEGMLVHSLANVTTELLVTIVAGVVFIATATVIAFRSGPRR
jgi:hypothetical protein